MPETKREGFTIAVSGVGKMANSRRKCKQCKEYFESWVTAPIGTFCTREHALLFAQEAGKKQQAKQLAKVKREKVAVEKVKRATHRELKESIKPLSKLKSEAQDAFNKYIRLRDFWEPCISCGKSKQEIEGDQGWKVGGCWDAGHFKSRGAKPQLRFILFNVNKECKSCNGGSGKYSHKAETTSKKYQANLIKKIGSEKVDWLNNNNDIVRFDADYYRRIKRIFNKKARDTQKRINKN